MAWSSGNTENFVLLTFDIQNIGENVIRDMWIGFATGTYAEHESRFFTGDGDLVGFLKTHTFSRELQPDRHSHAEYTINNDGDPVNGAWDYRSPLGATGLMFLGSTTDSPIVNFNWFAQSKDWLWGPAHRSNPGDPYRDVGYVFYTAGTAQEKYYVMSRHEIDYDMLFACRDYNSAGWLPPPSICAQIADGKGRLPCNL